MSDKSSTRKLGYGELAALAAEAARFPKEELKFKSPQEWRYIGKPAPGYDVTDVCSGKPLFGMDVRVDGMLYAAIAHPPVLGGKVKSVDDSALHALKVIGVKKTIPIDPFKPPHAFQPLGGVAVIADNTFAAFKGRKNLKIEWDNGSNVSYNSAEYKKELMETARQPGKVCTAAGDPDAGRFAGAARLSRRNITLRISRTASMEPPGCGGGCSRREGDDQWSPTQNPQGDAGRSGQALGLQKRKRRLSCGVSGYGGFGRKSEAGLCRGSGGAALAEDEASRSR